MLVQTTKNGQQQLNWKHEKTTACIFIFVCIYRQLLQGWLQVIKKIVIRDGSPIRYFCHYLVSNSRIDVVHEIAEVGGTFYNLSPCGSEGSWFGIVAVTFRPTDSDFDI